MVERTLITFASQLQLIERLQHLLYLSSSIIFISGEKGSGKSSLVEQLSNTLPNDTQQAFISLTEPVSITQIRQQIISQLFEHPLFNVDDSLSISLLLLKDKQVLNVNRTVVIDNASLLPESLLVELVEVINQKTRFSENEINFILLSDDLTSSQMAQTIKKLPSHINSTALSFKLAPLSNDESKQLLEHRFAQIGYSPEIQHQDAISTQLSYCQGIPEKILLLAEEVSSGEFDMRNPSWLRTRLPAILIMFLLMAIASSLAYYLYPTFVKDEETVEIVIESDALLPENIQSTKLITEEISGAMPTESLAGEWGSDKQKIIDNELSVGEVDSQESITISDQELLQLSISNSQVTTSTPNLLETVTDSTEERESKTQQTDSSTGLENKSENMIESAEGLNKFPEKAKSELVAIKEDLVIQQKASQPNEILQQDTSPLPQIKTFPSVLQENEKVFTPIADLTSVNPDMYTLQLSGFSNDESLERFIKQHQLPRKNVYLYKTVRNQKPWYVIIYGQFESREEARRVAQELPDTLNQLESWAKKYLVVHQDLLLNER